MENKTLFDLKHSLPGASQGTREWLSPRNLWISLGYIALPTLGFVSWLIENMFRGFGLFPQHFHHQNAWSSVELGLLQVTLFYGGVSLLVIFFVRGKLGRLVQALGSRHSQWRRWLILYCVVCGVLQISGTFDVDPGISSQISRNPIFIVLWPLLLLIGLSKFIEMKSNRAALADSTRQIDSEQKTSVPNEVSNTQTNAEFNLSSELANWRTSMLGYDSLSSDCVKELESHLMESIYDLKTNGFTGRESFRMAVERIGNQQSLASEFAADEPAAMWKKRAFWLGMGWLTTSMLPAVSMGIISLLHTLFNGALAIWDSFAHNYAPGILGSSQGLHSWWQGSENYVFFFSYFGVIGLAFAGTLVGKLDRFIDWISEHFRIFAILAIAYFLAEAAFTWNMILGNPQISPYFSAWQKNAYFLQMGVGSTWKLTMALLLGIHGLRQAIKRRIRLS